MAKRRFETEFFFDGKKIQTNRSSRAGYAVMRCIYHMEEDTYGATAAVVYDLETGKVYCEVVYPIGATEISILYKRKRPRKKGKEPIS